MTRYRTNLRRPPPPDPLERIGGLESQIASLKRLLATRTGSPIRLTAQSASIGATAFATEPSPGFYALGGLVQCTTAGTAGTVTLTLRWTDDAGATSAASAALTLAAVGRDAILMRPIRIASGNVTYETTVAGATGNPRYAVDCLLLRLPTDT